jgi:hypothetical protein
LGTAVVGRWLKILCGKLLWGGGRGISVAFVVIALIKKFFSAALEAPV